MNAFLAALLAGACTAAVLWGEHYALHHYRRHLATYPPDAYTIGVSTLFGGYGLWAVLTGTPLSTIGWLLVVTAIGGLGTRAAWWWHARQDAAEAADIHTTADKGAHDG